MVPRGNNTRNLKIHRNEWKWKQNIPKYTECSQGDVLKGSLCYGYIKKEK